MTLQTTGPINFTNIQNEFGGVTPISLSEYYALASGLPASGAISLNNFYGKQFVVYETITSSRTWTPKVNLARFIHIYVVGAGGSGGHGWADDQGATTGVAGGSGGGAGGVAYSVIAASSAGSSTITVGTGGAGVKVTSFGTAVYGNAGSGSSFVGSGLNMQAAGGARGGADTSTSSGDDRSALPGGTGGGASGGNTLNLTGGAGGAYDVSGTGTYRAASGGGAPRFLSANNGDGAFAGTSVQSVGGKVSGYGTYPAILNTYITGRDQTAIVNSGVTSFDASNGLIASGPTGSPTYGAGSGGSAHSSATGTGRGGNGVVFIIYEI